MVKLKLRIFSAIGAALILFVLAFNAFPVITWTDKDTGGATVAVAASDDYYAGIDETLTGTALRAEVAELITTTHTTLTTYNGLKTIFASSDADPDVSGNILWFYTGTSVTYSTTNLNSSSTNREHVWPKNGGNAFPEETLCGSDAHHLRPVNSSLNSSRSNNNFGEVATTNANIVKENGKTAYANLCYQSDEVFYPGENYRGATARILMYVQTRWGDDYDLSFVLGKGNNKTIGDIEDLLKWHYLEPPTAEEIARNEYVYSIQGNRNPFIDHPEYATLIYCYDGESYNSTLQAVAEEYDNYTVGEVATSITVSPASADIYAEDTVTLTVTATPKLADLNLKYETSDSSILTVDSKGVVTGVSEGTATVTVTDSNSGLTKTVIINVAAALSKNARTFKTYVLSAKAKQNTSTALNAISAALEQYEILTDDEKTAVYDDYQQLLSCIAAYNTTAESLNENKKRADESGLSPLLKTNENGD